jgi:hypothetical protein
LPVPLLSTPKIPRIQGYLEELELLPHGYILDMTIANIELESAIRSFAVGNHAQVSTAALA